MLEPCSLSRIIAGDRVRRGSRWVTRFGKTRRLASALMTLFVYHGWTWRSPCLLWFLDKAYLMEKDRLSPLLAVLFECLVEEEHEVLQEAELSGTLIQRTTSEASSKTMHFIGLDVHKKSISYCVKDAAGRVANRVLCTGLDILS
jgi:hypothetical protein